ncbi:MAG: porphobilinogen synthase [Methanomicrobiaceae archaeon]|nr:porphobilinogen synthase [Methanomicrobiaceae archaeon]
MYPQRRLRRLRKRAIQPLFRETKVLKEDLIAPVFFDENLSERKPIESMPGQFRYPVAEAADVAQRLSESGIQAMLLFGIPKSKDESASEAWNEEGVIQNVVRAIKSEVPDMVVITDVCACEYTSHGHCGIIGDTPCGPDLLNDPSLELMMRIAVSHAASGADIVAPSCMLDGQVTAIREALDEEGFEDIPVMSYSTKFASALYGPFREAADSGMAFGDRTTYQLECGNAREAFLESEMDLSEGADILMVKPAGFYHDIIASITSLGVPVAAYQVSGEYSMIKAASEKGWLDERSVVMESVKSIKRAGADLIITYFAEDIAGWLNEEQ